MAKMSQFILNQIADFLLTHIFLGKTWHLLRSRHMTITADFESSATMYRNYRVFMEIYLKSYTIDKLSSTLSLSFKCKEHNPAHSGEG